MSLCWNGPSAALNAATTRYTTFGAEMNPEYRKEQDALIHQARVTLIERNMVEALFLSLVDPVKGITGLNTQIRMCGQVLDAKGKPLIVPSEHLHPSVWRSAQLVIRGGSLE